MKCNNCGASMEEDAVRCPACGSPVDAASASETEPAPQPAKSAEPSDAFSSFSMPYLSAEATVKTSVQAETAMEDPQQLAQQAAVRRNKWIRRGVALGIVVVLLVSIILYVVFFGGYKKPLYQYVKGMDKQRGSSYTAIVPNAYLEYLEDTYDMNRREVKEMMGNYFTASMEKSKETYGSNVTISYDVLGTTEITDSQTLADYEDQLKESYNVDLSISKAVSVRTKLVYAGDTQSEYYTESLVFLKSGMKWYSLDAMKDMDYVAQYNGYGLW
ncbi:MAG: zinc-ribbon domain-containing protein [Ruminococcus sp.]|nr:zinc-ribbon domain-containing protein [Ruminococcus sp.]